MSEGMVQYQDGDEKEVPIYNQDGEECGYRMIKGTKIAYQGSGLNQGNEFSGLTAHANTKQQPKPVVFTRHFQNRLG